jgi:hypothetical protein
MKNKRMREVKTSQPFSRCIRRVRIQALGLLAGAIFSTTARGQSPPPNDAFASRITITGTPATVTGSNVGASRETGEPMAALDVGANNAGGKSVWWTWTAPTNGTVTVDTIGSSFDTLLGVYTGSSVSHLASLGGNDDGAGNGLSRVTFTATAGTSYQFQVDGFNPTTTFSSGVGYFGTNPISAASGFIQLNVWEGPLPPVITNQPKSLAVTNGSTATISVAASGATPLMYQWFKDSQTLTNANSNPLSLTNVQPTDSGAYSVLVSNVAGSAVSSNAVLTVAPVVITSPPTNIITGVGYNVSLQAKAQAIGPVSYQWQKDGNPLLAATNSNLTLSNVQPADAGNYTLIASNNLATATSSVATVTVLPYT